MDITRLNDLGSVFGRRHTRRNTLKYAGLGLGAAAFEATGLTMPAVAQDATPAPEVD